MRHILPIALNQLGALLFGLIGIKLISQLVSPGVYGAYALFLTLTQLGPMLTHSGLSNHAARYWQRERPQAGAYAWFLWVRSWRDAVWLGPVLAMTGAGLLLAQKEIVWIWLLPLLFLSNVVTGIQTIALAALNASERFWRMFWLGTIASGARVFLPLVAVMATSATLLHLCLGFTAHALLVLACIVALFWWVRRPDRREVETERRWRTELRDYGRPYILMGVGAWLLANADRWIVASFFGEEQAGLFALASGMAAVAPTLALGGLMQVVFPKVFREADAARTRDDWERLAKQCDQMTLLFLGLSLAGLAGLCVLGPYMLGWLVAPKYAPALVILLPAGCGVITAQVNQFQYLLLQGQHNSSGMVKVMAVVAASKTLGTILAALISWRAVLSWLILSVAVNWLLGRWLIRSMALGKRSPAGEPSPGAEKNAT